MIVKKILSVCILLFCASCVAQQRDFAKINDQEEATIKEFENLPIASKLQMVSSNEPGEKLILCLTFIDKKTKKPLKDQDVLLYQTSNDGDYHPEVAGDEKTARISGLGFTDAKGRLFIRTILPGSYATSGDNRHIHTKVFDARPTAYDIHFKQYTSSRMRRFIESRDQFFLIDLKHTKEGKLIGFLTIEVKNPK